jgi:hypothetical protein
VRIRTLVLALCIGFGNECVADEGVAAHPLWSKRGVFSFEKLVLDFDKELEVVGPITTPLVNCSDQNFYCA